MTGSSRAASGAAPAGPGGQAALSTAGNIYDLGYRAYDGPRLGRRHAVWALYLFSLRGAFGIGRGGRAKIAPFGLALLALLPALIAVGLAALLSQAGRLGALNSPIQYGTYLGYTETVLTLFCAAQAPELVGRDQRYHVLSLYFSRALRRSDYAIAKLAALATALFLVFTVPELLLFAGQVLAAQDVPAAFFDNIGALPPVVAIGLSVALVLGGISLALASYTPRRSYATAAIIAVFAVPPIVALIVSELVKGPAGSLIVAFDPVDVLSGLNAWLFDRPVGNEVLVRADLPGAAFVLAAAAYVVGTAVALLRRYARIVE
jgi:ABC-2 type transport system permease protein